MNVDGPSTRTATFEQLSATRHELVCFCSKPTVSRHARVLFVSRGENKRRAVVKAKRCGNTSL
jgi:hypothetical protein